MHTRVANIPCQVLVTYYDPGRPDRLSGHPDTWYPGEYEDVEFQVLDRRGRAAPWLTAKLDDEDRQRIIRELHEYWQKEAETGDY